MAWSYLPVSQGDWITVNEWNEAIAAINERCTELSVATLSTVSSGDWIRVGTLTDMRSKIETIIPSFRRVDDGDGEVYDKATCLTDAISQADWTDASIAAGDWIRIVHLNEIRLVLNKLTWLGIQASSTDPEKRAGQGQSNTSWADAWSLAKTDYGGNSFANDATVNNRGGIGCTSESPSAGFTYGKFIRVWRENDASYTVPNYTVNVGDTKMLFRARIKDTISTDYDLHEQAAFAGGSTSVTVDATEDKVVDVSTVTKNTTVHYSWRTNPASPTLDSYEPGDSDGASLFNLLQEATGKTSATLLVELAFTYA